MANGTCVEVHLQRYDEACIGRGGGWGGGGLRSSFKGCINTYINIITVSGHESSSIVFLVSHCKQ